MTVASGFHVSLLYRPLETLPGPPFAESLPVFIETKSPTGNRKLPAGFVPILNVWTFEGRRRVRPAAESMLLDGCGLNLETDEVFGALSGNCRV